MIPAGIELENVDKAKLAAGPVFNIIDLVCTCVEVLWANCIIYLHN